MISALMIFAFLCVLIIPLRGPSKNNNIKRKKPRDFSKYAVTKDGWLEMMDENKKQ